MSWGAVFSRPIARVLLVTPHLNRYLRTFGAASRKPGDGTISLLDLTDWVNIPSFTGLCVEDYLCGERVMADPQRRIKIEQPSCFLKHCVVPT